MRSPDEIRKLVLGYLVADAINGRIVGQPTEDDIRRAIRAVSLTLTPSEMAAYVNDAKARTGAKS